MCLWERIGKSWNRQKLVNGEILRILTGISSGVKNVGLVGLGEKGKPMGEFRFGTMGYE